MRRPKRRTLLAFAGVLGLLAVGRYVYLEHKYPFGWSHCCDKFLGMTLRRYADGHGGWFPRGEANPEASLGLLHRFEPESASANLLRGKTVPEADVAAKLNAGELLTPETCGWHYVEGLRSDDSSSLALFWDKAGLGHNGERLGGGHLVTFVRGETRHVPGEEWEAFLAEQERLRAALRR